MNQYGKTAILATDLYRNRQVNSPQEAWGKALAEIDDKDCPRCAYIDLCNQGFIRDIPHNADVKHGKNGNYAIIAINLLQNQPTLANNISALWREVLKKAEIKSKAHNQQMDVVVALWNNGDIEKHLQN